MKNLYLDTRVLDERASEKFDLSEELLMENAAAGIANFIRKKFKKARGCLAFVVAEITVQTCFVL